jgi:hypothetical protein
MEGKEQEAINQHFLTQVTPKLTEIARDEKGFIEGLLRPIEQQKQKNIATGDFRCIGGCGAKVSSANGACGWAGGVCPACQH